MTRLEAHQHKMDRQLRLIHDYHRAWQTAVNGYASMELTKRALQEQEQRTTNGRL